MQIGLDLLSEVGVVCWRNRKDGNNNSTLKKDLSYMCRIQFDSIVVSIDDGLDSYLNEFTGTIMLDDGQIVGEIRGYYVDVRNARDDDEDVHSIFDLEEQSYEFYPHLYNENGDVNDLTDYMPESFGTRSNVLIITYLKIEKEHRGNSIGLRVVRRTIQQLGNGADICCLHAHPVIEESELEDDHSVIQEKLVNYYSRLGFVQIDSESYVMVVDIADAVPVIV